MNQQMSFSEQVVSMFSVDILFTVHGAGLTTSLFMLPGSALVEVFPPFFIEPYYMWVARFSDLVYRRITETKMLDKRDYYYIRKKIDLTNKVFYLPPQALQEKLESVVPLVWKNKYSMVMCSRVCYETGDATRSRHTHLISTALSSAGDPHIQFITAFRQ